MINTCKNCNHTISENFCENCGQSVEDSERINLHHILYETNRVIFHIDKGILYTLKELALRSGHTLKEYLDGKRIKHYKPFGFVVVMATFYMFLIHFFHLPFGYTSSHSNTMKIIEKHAEWIHSYYSLIALFCAPFNALCTYLIFRKEKYNYLEYLIINLYIIGFQIFISSLLLPIHFIYPSWYSFLAVIFIFSYQAVTYIQLFNHAKKSHILIKVVILYLLNMTIITIVLVILLYPQFYNQFYQSVLK